MKHFRVTKFDTAKRNPDGSYMDQQEWTCLSEIGKNCGGTVLTEAAYLATETRYVNAVLRFFAASGLPHLRVTNFSNRFASEELPENAAHYPTIGHPALEELNFVEDQIVTEKEIALLVRQTLRGTVNCSLESDGFFFVHFGWDYYMYIGCAADCSRARAETQADGMFVEDFVSPHARPDGSEIPLSIQVTELEKDFIIVDGDKLSIVGNVLQLNSSDWRHARKIFGYSNEHPFFGYYPMTQETAAKFAAEFDLPLAPDRCELVLDTTGS